MKINSLYIHIPFCSHICDYCDFPKLQYFRNFASQYLEILKQEIDSLNINKGLKTIYVGGGTPTALEDDLFLRLLKIIKPYSMGVKEYTFEANPESLSLDKLQMLKSFGVNRLSIGVETTDDEILRKINRHHQFSDVQIAIRNARKMGFDNINVDLIIGLPHVKKGQFIKDLDNILALGVDHISCYSLTVHPNTMFFLKEIPEPKEEFARSLYDIAEEKLKENGFIHYEISNWAKAGKESEHNFTYWKDEPYYGVGLGAAGYIGDTRYVNTRNLTKYLNGNYVEEKETVRIEDDLTYFIMLNLRTNRGIIFSEFKDRFKEDFLEKYKEIVDEFVSQKLLVINKDRVYPTYEGMMVLDQMIMEFIK